MNTTYKGSDLFGIDFCLYGLEDINFKESKEEIQNAFVTNYEFSIKTELAKIGFELVKFNYFSPMYYNYQGDSLDIEINLINPSLLTNYAKYIAEYEFGIDELLKENQSSDGYMARTVRSCTEELNNIIQEGKDFVPDIIILKCYLEQNIDFSDFDIHEFFVYEDEKCYICNQIQDDDGNCGCTNKDSK